MGSSGGDGTNTGGRGGGTVKVTVGILAFIDGDILADGGDGQSAGGGSGGSIWVITGE